MERAWGRESKVKAVVLEERAVKKQNKKITLKDISKLDVE